MNNLIAALALIVIAATEFMIIRAIAMGDSINAIVSTGIVYLLAFGFYGSLIVLAVALTSRIRRARINA